jgi:hypothetical protein
MDKIIEKYYLKPGSKLVSQQIRTNGVDCWFDVDDVRQHRCIDFEDFIRTFTTPKEELKRYKLFSTITCNLDENLRNKVWKKVDEELSKTPEHV